MTIASPPIDKLALIYLVDHRILMTQSRGQETFYIPGGKREVGESDLDALTREIREELSVELDPSTIQYYGAFTAQAHGKPQGTLVKMTCYTARLVGTPSPSSEIQSLSYYSYSKREIVGPVDKLIFDDLHSKGLLQ